MLPNHEAHRSKRKAWQVLKPERPSTAQAPTPESAATARPKSPAGLIHAIIPAKARGW